MRLFRFSHTDHADAVIHDNEAALVDNAVLADNVALVDAFPFADAAFAGSPDKPGGIKHIAL